MRYNGRDPAGDAIALRGYAALESFEQPFDFSLALPLDAFALDLFRAEDGTPTVIKLIRIQYANDAITAAWRAGLRQSGAIPNGCRDSLFLAADPNLPVQNTLQANGYLPSLAENETNWEVDYLIKPGRQVGLFFDFKFKPNVNQALNPVGKVFLHLARIS